MNVNKRTEEIIHDFACCLPQDATIEEKEKLLEEVLMISWHSFSDGQQQEIFISARNKAFNVKTY